MSAEHETYVIKSGGRPSGDPSKYDFDVIQSLLDATDPGKVSAAGYSYNTAARIMAQVAHRLYLVGNGLAGKWEGADATAAQTALGQLYATANELYWRSRQAGAALQTYGAALDQYKGLKWPAGGASPAEDPARQQAAQKVMQSLNQHIGNAWDTMPDKVQSNLPSLTGRRNGTPYPSGPKPTGTSGGSSDLGNAGSTHAPSGHVRLTHVPQGGGQSPVGGQGTKLAGAPPTGSPAIAPPSTGNTFSPGTPTGFPSPVGGGFSPGGMPPSFSGGRFGSGSPPGEAPGQDGVASDEPLAPTHSTAGAAEGAAAAEEDAAVGRSVPIGPGGVGAAGARNSVDRERSTRLTEDRDIWSAGEEATPEVLGAPSASEGPGDEETRRQRTAWLDEEREVWTGPETAVRETIGGEPSNPAVVEETGDAEPDILNVSQLQELLDALVPDDDATGHRPRAATESAGFFGGADNIEVNEIDRLLNG